MRLRIWTILIVLQVSGCASSGFDGPVPDISMKELLSGRAIFGQEIDTSTVSDPGLFEVDDDMRAFVARHVGDGRTERDRMRRLLSAMLESGLLSLEYEDMATKTARATFHDRASNCLSFTTLFVALGREAGLDVSFQTVAVPPNWNAHSGLVFVNTHVNALVKLRADSPFVVDFNAAEVTGNYETVQISDAYALALYYNNISMDALRDGNDEAAFRLLKKSIEVQNEIAASWANLAVIYSRNGATDYAIRAYAAALDLDRIHGQSLTNLASLYRREGMGDVADKYQRRIRRYQERNPYYHYFHAVAAYNNEEFEPALKRIERALRLKSTDDEFYRLQGLIYARLGNADMALDSFTRARDLALFPDAREIYSDKISP